MYAAADAFYTPHSFRFFGGLVVPLAGDAQDAIFHIDVDVLRLHTWHVGTQYIAILLLDDINRRYPVGNAAAIVVSASHAIAAAGNLVEILMQKIDQVPGFKPRYVHFSLLI